MVEQTHRNVLYVKCEKRKMRSSFSSFGIPNLPSALSLSLPPFHPGRASEGIGISNQDAGVKRKRGDEYAALERAESGVGDRIRQT